MADGRRPLLLLCLVFLINGQEDACFNVAVQGTEKHIPCKATCNELSITGVTWTLQSYINSRPKWNITINQDGSIDGYNVPSGINVDENDVLIISSYSSQYSLHSASVTCHLLVLDNSTCNSSHLILTVLVPPSGIGNFILATYPTFLLDTNNHHRYAGQSFGLCVQVQRDGVSANKNKIYWSNGNIRFFPQYVTNGTCSDCQCLFNQIRANPRTQTQAFLYLFKTEQCYSRYDKFRAVLFLHHTELVDSGSYRFYFTDYFEHTYTGDLKAQSLSISYASIEPKFITPSFDKTIEMIKETNNVIFCNATTSIEQSLEWVWQGMGPINKLHVNCTSPLSDCVCYKEGDGIYEVSVVQERKSLPQQNEGAYFMHYSIALVICNTSFVVNTNFTCQVIGNVTYKRHLFIIVPTITASPSTTVVASSIPLSSPYLIMIFILIPILVLLFVLVSVCLLIVCCCLRFRAQKRHTSPDLPLSPLFDIDSMEFPRDRLTLDVLLGEGQFGEVWKAQAVGIVPGDHSRNVVAVKTIKSTGTHLDEDDLVSELNIMKIIKPHPNILNLLGYCTKPYDRPLYIIMEYAAHGNLRNYLKNLRRIQQHPTHSCHITYTDLNGSVTYVSRLQVNTPPCPPTPCKTLGEYLTLREQNEEPCLCDVIDTPRCPYCCHGNECEDSWRLYANLLDREGDNHQSVFWQHIGSSDYYNQYVIEGGGPIEPTSEDTRQQRMSCVSTVSTPCHVTTKATPSDMSKNELPNLTDICNVTAKDPPNVRCMTTEECSDISDEMTLTEDPNLLLSETDVFNFALQISRGMEHLEKMRCLHRDLAARNILIAEGFLLKVADFGLSRELKDKDYYRKLTSGKLPARWMALESLDSERLHTHKSDVWSFGVVLWEILTYGDVPYCIGDIASTLESLLLFIKDGNRLPRPDQCSDEMYKLMLQCWDVNPAKRPSFSELVKIFDGLLSIAHGYLPMAEDVASNQSLVPVELDSTPNQTECQVATQTASSNLTLSENTIQCSTPRNKEELNSLASPVSFKWPSVNDTAPEDEACKPKTLDPSTKKPLQRTSKLM